ncbi:two-component sensor histidine kinase [Segetibacter sp. 3557_3]|uniref:sensor histidine kinase n=1 Tax=Segetibacter sp. 3557_3 TaxID=2547429 RepID=UPI0010590237|nr:ATP-binding protein [Segetibacter sp. 3557_3]TDH25130.1 two-component sensor histidine kinase [Segetibacter sp. 3557_3]
MKSRNTSRKLRVITIVYWFLLLYVVAALVWWFSLLERQNRQMTDYKLQELVKTDPDYHLKVKAITSEKRRQTRKFALEGVVFLGLIIISAIYVYRATRRQFRLSLQQQNFMMAITHELKTPIAVTLLNLETLQKHRLDEGRQQKLIANTIQEANRLNTLCNNILLASQLEARAYQLNRVELNLSEVVEDCIAEFENHFPGRKINGNVDQQVFFTGEHLLLQVLVNNLLENAQKYTPRDIPIKVDLAEQMQRIVLKVADHGPGIPEDEKRKIFEKFYRIGNEATRNTKGTGLGLYLCKRIANDHGGDISVKNNEPQGSVFTVTLNKTTV